MMAKGSQLSQLKSALAEAGIKKHSGKKKKSTPLTEHAKVKKAAKLREIQQKLNPFDVKVTRLKHDVGGRKVKGAVGRPAQSKQAGMQQREKSLLKEVEQRGRVGGVVDRRFGESDPSMSLEDRMLERFTRERQRVSRSSAFNLENEDELTHYGQSLSKLDDFDDILMPVNEDEEGQLDHDTVKLTHFGGFDDDDENKHEPDRKKSKAEVMAEVIAKSKAHKMRRQMEKEQEENIRHELDQDFDSLRTLLYAPDPSSVENDISDVTKLPVPAFDEDSVDYDRQVRELAFDKRAKPKDRTKTEEELALEQKEALEKAEKQRRLRMLGQDPGENEDEDSTGRGRKRPRGGDDLEDDFVEDEPLGGIGTGLGVEPGSEASEGGADSSIDDSDEDHSDEGSDFDGFGEEDQATSDEPSDLEEEDTTSETKLKRKIRRPSETRKAEQELPYTFPAPESHDGFLEIVEGLPDSDVPIVVQRIRTLYHHSLGPENKLKLQNLGRVLIDHILYIASPPAPRIKLLSALVPHSFALCRSYPIELAGYFVEKLSLMHKNLKHGLATGALEPDARTWPGISELVFLRVIGIVWPTSDMRHPVISPARLLMGAYLGLCRYESLSKRFVPEAINFLVNVMLHLAPHTFSGAEPLPGAFSCPDLRTPLCEPLAVDGGKAKDLVFRTPDLAVMASAEPTEQFKIDSLGLAFDLLERFADIYKSLDGFIELYEPISHILSGLECRQLSSVVQSRVTSLQDKITRLLKISRQSRKPLFLQAHKPIPIATYIPKFETSSSYTRRHDPDRERNETSKLRYQLKQERKGAIRELRKDAKFLANVEHKKQVEKDKVYKERMNKVFSSLEGERAEQKAMEREKTRERRRAGRR